MIFLRDRQTPALKGARLSVGDHPFGLRPLLPRRAGCLGAPGGGHQLTALCFAPLSDREIWSIFYISWLFRISIFLIFWHLLKLPCALEDNRLQINSV